MTSLVRRLLLLGIGLVVVGATVYSTVGRPTGLPSAQPGSAIPTPQPTMPASDDTRQAAERAQQLQQRLAENPQDAEALSEVVDGLFQAKRYAQAAEVLSEAIDAGAESPRLRMGLGIALFYQGLPSLAQRELKRAIELDPSFVEARFNYALTLTHAARADPDAARAAWQEVVRLDPDGDLGRRAGEYLAQPAQ
jgi:cytochrome c-type biogenesis protein CcmH/NrfG